MLLVGKRARPVPSHSLGAWQLVKPVSAGGMRANRLRWFPLFSLMGVVLSSPAQQSDRKLLAEIRAKAESGDAQSQFELGRACELGSLGVAKDEAETVKWYRKAAEQNFSAAQYNLG